MADDDAVVVTRAGGSIGGRPISRPRDVGRAARGADIDPLMETWTPGVNADYGTV